MRKREKMGGGKASPLSIEWPQLLIVSRRADVPAGDDPPDFFAIFPGLRREFDVKRYSADELISEILRDGKLVVFLYINILNGLMPIKQAR